MKTKYTTFAIQITLISIISLSCANKDQKEVELEIRENQLALKEKEINLKDSILNYKAINSEKEQSKTSTQNSKTTYVLVNSSGKINKNDISKLSEPLKAIAAFYSGLGGTNCENDECELTKALGLGKQGSKEHKQIISKWLPSDKAAMQVVAQNCIQSPSGSSDFSDYTKLSIEQNLDTIFVNYSLLYWNYGDNVWVYGPDKYLIQGNKIKTLKRNIWKEIDKY
jgi:hypothetical protein